MRRDGEIKQAIQAGHRSAQASFADDAWRLCYKGRLAFAQNWGSFRPYIDNSQSAPMPMLFSLWLKTKWQTGGPMMSHK